MAGWQSRGDILSLAQKSRSAYIIGVVEIILYSAIFIVISAICSLVEAALYAVQPVKLKALADKGSAAAKVIVGMRRNIGRPVAAILVVNTTVTAAGGTFLGYLASDGLTQVGASLVAIFFSGTILICGEILPKIIGVNFAQPVVLFFAYPLKVICLVLWPVVALAEMVSKRLGGDKADTISYEEVLTVAKMGREAGGIDQLESTVIKNVIKMDSVLVKSVLTPRLHVFRLPEDAKISEAIAPISEQAYSRVPLHADGDRDDVRSYVIQADVYRAYLAGDRDFPLAKLARELRVVPDLMRADKLFLSMMDSHEHIVAAVDEYGSFAGVITLEDLLEHVMGREIADETDGATSK